MIVVTVWTCSGGGLFEDEEEEEEEEGLFDEEEETEVVPDMTGILSEFCQSAQSVNQDPLYKY